MAQRTKGVTVAVLALAAAGVSVYFAFSGRSEKIDLGPYEVLGVVTAEETAKLLGKGNVLLMAQDTGAYKNPSVEAQVKAFQTQLKRQGGLSVVTEKVPITAALMLATGGGVPADQLFKSLESHANVNALVLFFRFPMLAGPEMERLQKSGVKTVVVSSYYSDYKRLFERQALHLAIVPRFEGPVSDPPPARTARERFDQQFTVITAADVGKLP